MSTVDQTSNTAATTQPTAGSATTGGGDMLDKGVDYLERQAGHEQVRTLTAPPTTKSQFHYQSHSTTEKISDGIRTGFTKLTGESCFLAYRRTIVQ